MSMSDAYQRCEELGIPTDAPDALDRLWSALSVDERHEVFPFANDDESSHVVVPVQANLDADITRYCGASMPSGATCLRPLNHAAEHVYTDAEHVPEGAARPAAVPPVRGRLTFPPADGAARARELAAEHIRRARARLDNDVPKGGRPWRPGDTPRGAVLREAADVLARLAAVYLGADSAHESPRNHDEARAYALAFRLVETSARRLAMRRYR